MQLRPADSQVVDAEALNLRFTDAKLYCKGTDLYSNLNTVNFLVKDVENDNRQCLMQCYENLNNDQLTLMV